jgi:hypothetical protein
MKYQLNNRRLDMSKRIALILSPVAIGAVIFYINGCTLIGMGIGALADSKSKKTYAGWEIAEIKPGKEVTLYLRDGTVLTGDYMGITQVAETVYAQNYSRFCESCPAVQNLPHLDDKVTIFLNDGKMAAGSFAGFDCRFDNALADPCIAIRDSIGMMPRTAAIYNISAVKSDAGDSLDIRGLAEMMNRGAIPVITAASLKMGSRYKDVSIEKIVMVKTKGSHSGLTAGLVIGAIIDGAILIAASRSNEPEPRPEPDNDPYTGAVSCPFIYSFDGEKYIRDSETFGGAIFKAAQRTDFDNLDHLRAFDGTYKLKVTNELEETQYIDELKLMVVDHPGNLTVIPSFAGRLHTFSNPLSPSSALDFRGNNVKELVQRRDSDFWISNPFGRNPDNLSEVRDGILLDFPRPSKSDFVKLALNLQNTNWAAHMQGEMLNLQGSELDEWYELMNSSAEARQNLQAVMVREGMLLVKIWDGRGWRTADFVWEVGPSVSKDQAVMIDLRDIPGDTLKIRLESTAGFWMINSVIADYTPDVPVEVAELSLQRAVDVNGRDLLGLLSQDDRDYYVMPSKADWAELEFAAPPSRSGFDRSFVMKSTGYYTINVIADGEPQRELVSDLMKNPGAYGQFALRKLYEDFGLAMADSEQAGGRP